VHAFRRILATERGPTYVTKVLLKTAFGLWLAICVAPGMKAAVLADEKPTARPGEALYLQLGQVGLDPARVYKVRGASIERAAVHITLDDGTIGFTQDVMGRTTGAFFEGEGEILLTPPNDVERGSMSLFTDMAILEERFATAYFRFNDETMGELRPDLRTSDNAQEFVLRWNETAHNLAQADAMRLLLTFSRSLPISGATAEAAAPVDREDRLLHARLQGTKLGVFDVYFDSLAAEQVQIGQARAAKSGVTYYDVWASFSPIPPGHAQDSLEQASESENVKPREDAIAIRTYNINVEVEPPKKIHAEARLQVNVQRGEWRALLFELSRFLQIETVEMDGHPVEFIHNPAVEGTQLARRGNDSLIVILPEPARSHQQFELRFVYGGEVLAEAGKGLLYVGARGIWYPNRGLAMADFDLTFRYPSEWTLVATGKPTPPSTSSPAPPNNEQQAHWVSERPIPVAGFDLGKYKVATVQAGNVTVETYATPGMERDFPSAPIQVIESTSREPHAQTRGVEVYPAHNPSPVHTQLPVAEAAARAIRYYADRFGPFPYSRLAFTQIPGVESQGWPSMVFLSSYAFLTEEEQIQLRYPPSRRVLQQQIPAHETAHQWWGDLITWSSYRDQWFSEGLANYCALMMVQEKDPAAFREIMDRYRDDLLGAKDVSPMNAGPVTLGGRLLSSRFPEGYEAISYGRGTWLFHMLRTMLQDAAQQEPGEKGRKSTGPDEPFVRALRKLRERYEGKTLSTRQLFDVFAEDLPPALRYEEKKSLDWFLVGWVNGTSVPKLELKSVKYTVKGNSTVVTGTILQKDAPDSLVTSVPVYSVLAGKKQALLGRVFADGSESSFHLTAPLNTHKIVLDPNGTILTGAK
jgi:hypothetical protein